MASVEEVRFPADDGFESQGWIARPDDAGPFPALILLPGINGVGEHHRAAAARFAAEGVMTALFDFTSREKDPPDPVLVGDFAACLHDLKADRQVDPERIALGGYCRGGTLALLGLSQIAGFNAGIIFHGIPFYREGTNERRPHHAYELAEGLTTPLLWIHGASDTTAPVDEVFRYAIRLNELGKHVELKVYAGAQHAFTLPGGGGRDRYHPENAEDAFREAVLFLRRVNGIRVGTVAPAPEPVTV
jgi:carboxymethylenebutenolidase